VLVAPPAGAFGLLIDWPMTARRLALALALALPPARFAVLAGLAVTLACSSPNGNELFAKNSSATGAAANLGGSSGASAGSDSVAHQTQADGGANEAPGGSTSGGSAGGGADLSQGGSSGSGGQAMLESCDAIDGAVKNEQNGHCYRVNSENLTFAAARDACQVAGGYLITISSQEENDFARDLDSASHWLGASDGLPDTMAGVGSYAWVNQEAWAYTNWREGQPNAVETDCPGHSGGGGCFEHCAYQAAEGDWIDRSCGQTILAICEWEPPRL
jgi:Lectin C-type domain